MATKTPRSQPEPPVSSTSATGLFLCGCEGKISSVVDLQTLAERFREDGGLRLIETHDCLCGEEGLRSMRAWVESAGVQSILVAGCSPRSKLWVIREEAEAAGLNSLMVEMANVRDRCALAHGDDPTVATQKAELLIHGFLDRMRNMEELRSIAPKPVRTRQPVGRRSLLRSAFNLFRERRATAILDTQMCADALDSCQRCIESCPHDAISNDRAAPVSEDLCRACGICSGVCPIGAVQLPNWTDQQVISQLRALLRRNREELQPRVIVFSCVPSSKRIDEAAGEGNPPGPNVLVIDVPCLGMISEIRILKALELGAAGVILSKRPCEDCDHGKGRSPSKRAFDSARGILALFGLNPQSLQALDIPEDGPEALNGVVDQLLVVSKADSDRLSIIEGDTQLGPARRESLLSILRAWTKRTGAISDFLPSGESPPFAQVKVDTKKCTFCGICAARCPTGALELVNGSQLHFTHSLCFDCGVCDESCPEDAIGFDPVFDMAKIVDQTRDALARQEALLCAECGEPFLPDATLRAVSKALNDEGGGTEHEAFIRLCYDCRAKRLISG
jgi:ferredoxin